LFSSEELIQALVEEVYRKLVENDAAVLRRASHYNLRSARSFLLLISINVVRKFVHAM
jgi:hypothetical protein